MKKIKSKLIKAAATAASSLSLIAVSISSVAAAKSSKKSSKGLTPDNFVSGVDSTISSVMTVVIPIYTSIATLATLVLFGIALAKSVKELASSHTDNRDIDYSKFAKWWLGVLICALATAPGFYATFGLGK